MGKINPKTHSFYYVYAVLIHWISFYCHPNSPRRHEMLFAICLVYDLLLVHPYFFYIFRGCTVPKSRPEEPISYYLDSNARVVQMAVTDPIGPFSRPAVDHLNIRSSQFERAMMSHPHFSQLYIHDKHHDQH